ncbi:ser/Thr protein phosphatase family protein [Venturia nashicola]|uniref:Ser/Thr protein phosphatase family protein n=1 Tax=Venturia nashicola TaxID=86259 RepID=A0A4Z1NXC9_9PEZI|nr:ser/Thr protein phosphatase family protein [Venturia nashicola]TLD18221.1 ser/Thr protein phosphatase family protein [Venturia nashicola]
MAAPAGNQPRPYAQAASSYQSNGAPPPVPQPMPGAVPLLPNQGRVIQQGPVRVLCVADVRGNLRSLNTLAKEARANYIVHTGDFGFYDDRSLDRIAEKTLRHVAQYSPLLAESVKRQIATATPQPSIKERIPRDQLPLSELPLFLNKTYTLDVPVYTVWGACEDVQVLEKLRSGEHKIDNLHIIDEANSRLLDVGGVKLRILGLGGAVVMHKLFDNGEGRTTIAGGQGTMWTTLLQMGELIDTANRVYDPTETRLFVTHASPAREGLLNQLSVTLKADFSISAGLHFRYGSSYNEFSVNPTLDHYRGKLAASKASFDDVWQTVKNEVEPAVEDNESQKRLLAYALDLVQKMPVVANGGNPFGGQSTPGSGQIDESAFKNMWNFNLADAAYGWLVLDIDAGRIGTEMRAQGFNFAHRGGKGQPQQQQGAPAAASSVSGPASGGPQPTAHTQLPPPQPQQVPRPMTQQQPQPRGPSNPTPPNHARQGGPHAARTGPSPSPVVPKETIKSATPQPPSAPSGPSTEKSVASDNKSNGTPAADKAADPSKDSAPEKKAPPPPSQSLFVRNAKDEDHVRSFIAEEDRSNIEKIEKSGQFWIVRFKSVEFMTEALKHVSSDLKARQSDPTVPSITIYRERENHGPRQPREHRDHHGAGNWQASNRGGVQGPGGYRSGGASDSEGGRGGFRGRGGSRGGRGGERGGRGNRGNRGGRGEFNKGGEGSGSGESKPAPSGES